VQRAVTFYPNAAGNATTHPETKDDLKRRLTAKLGQELTNYLFQSAQVHTVHIHTLSAVIDEQGIPTIDLLKIDTESDELAVLQGISEAHYSIIG
jgi:FkbM family methyltransferase